MMTVRTLNKKTNVLEHTYMAVKFVAYIRFDTQKGMVRAHIISENADDNLNPPPIRMTVRTLKHLHAKNYLSGA